MIGLEMQRNYRQEAILGERVDGIEELAVCFLGLAYCFFQAEDVILDLVRSRWLVDVYKGQVHAELRRKHVTLALLWQEYSCLLYTYDAADDILCVDPGGRRSIKKKTL